MSRGGWRLTHPSGPQSKADLQASGWKHWSLESEGGAGKEMNANQERFMAEVVLSWLLNVTPALSGRLPGLPGIPQDVAGLTRKFETSPVGGPTCRKTPISVSA